MLCRRTPAQKRQLARPNEKRRAGPTEAPYGSSSTTSSTSVPLSVASMRTHSSLVSFSFVFQAEIDRDRNDSAPDKCGGGCDGCRLHTYFSKSCTGSGGNRSIFRRLSLS